VPSNLDLWLLLIGCIFFYLGTKTGFLRSALSLILTYFCFYFAQQTAPSLIRAFSFFTISEVPLANSVVAIALFLGVSFVGELVLVVLKNLVTISFLGPADKILGGVISAFRFLLILGFFLQVSSGLSLSPDTRDSMGKSEGFKYGEKAYQQTYPMALSIGKKTTKTKNFPDLKPANPNDIIPDIQRLISGETSNGSKSEGY